LAWPDLVNALFELGGSLAVGASITRLWTDRRVAGVSVLMIGFFASWGLWNLFYYPSLGQHWSFAAGVLVCLANVIYCSMLIYYQRHPGGIHQ
jgi:hypothetical protein